MLRRGRVGVTAAGGEGVDVVVANVDGERVSRTNPLSGSTMFLYRDPAISTSRCHVASSADAGAASAKSSRSAALSSPAPAPPPLSSMPTTSASTDRSEPTRTGSG